MLSSEVRITDVAKAAGVSQSTASFVLGGKGDEMHISKETQELVWQTSRQMGYQPRNIVRRMRVGKPGEGVPTITIYWAGSDADEYPQLTRTFAALRSSIARKNLNLNIMLKSFNKGQLSEVLAKDASHYFSGTVVGGATAEDVAAVSASGRREPIVFIEQNVKRYNGVYTDQRAGAPVAARLVERGFSSAAIVLPPRVQMMMVRRRDDLEQHLRERGLRCLLAPADPGVGHLEGGRATTMQLMCGEDRPEVLIYLHEELALAGVGALHEMGLRGGRDVEVISFAGGRTLAFVGMPVSRLVIPHLQIADRAIEVLMEQIEDRDRAPQSVACNLNIEFAGRLADEPSAASGSGASAG